MEKTVVIFSFPNPESALELGDIISKAKSLFTGVSQVKIHLATAKAAENILWFLRSGGEESNLIDHAKRELALLDNEEEFNESIIRAIEGFNSFGHSGGSAPIAIALLNDLLQYKNLTPITDDPDDWNYIPKDVAGTDTCWQSKRNPEIFSNDGGKTYYFVGGAGGKGVTIHISEKSK